ncbi:tetratricopeptide repeat protein [Magnetococcales bacterium HHB-1]
MKQRIMPYLPWLLLSLLLLATMLIYSPSLNYGFLNWDDLDYITANGFVRAGFHEKSIAWAFYNATPYWMPVTWLSFMANVSWGDLDPFFFHLTNTLLHLANITLVFILFYRRRKDLYPAFLIAALFAFHPRHVEAVVWIAERKEVLSFFFGMLTLWSYQRFAILRDQPDAPAIFKHHKALIWITFSLFCYLLSLLSKPLWVTLPLLLLLLDFWPLRRFEKHNISTLIKEKLPFILLALVIGELIFLLAQDKNILFSLGSYSWPHRISNALLAPFKHLWHSLWPFNLTVHYPFNETPPPLWQPILALLALLTLAWLAFINRLRYPSLLFGMGWFLVALAPVSGILQAGIAVGLADRWMYLPHIGLFAALIYALKDHPLLIKLPSKTVPLLMLSLLLFWGWRSSEEIKHWESDLTLWQHAKESHPNSYTPPRLLGAHYFNTNQWEKALPYMQEAIRLGARHRRNYARLGLVLMKLNRKEEAIKAFRTAARYPKLPGISPQLAFFVGQILFKEQLYKDAEPYLKAAVYKLPPGKMLRYMAHFRYALILDATGKKTQSKHQLNHFFKLFKNRPNFKKAWCTQQLNQTSQHQRFQHIHTQVTHWCR